MASIRILHISDLHERAPFPGMPETRRPKLEWDAEERGYVLGPKFLEALDAIARSGVDLVCFTGDLADWGHPDEYLAATIRLDALLKRVGVPRDRFFAVPGNHDVQRGINVDAWQGIRKWANDSHDFPRLGRWLRHVIAPPLGIQDAWRDAILERSAEFWKWLAAFRGDDLRKRKLLGYRHTLQPGMLHGVDKPVHIVGLDSAWMCGSDDDQGTVLVTEEQVQAHVRQGPERLDGIRIGLIHHPLDHLGDHHEVRRILGDDGVDLLLHGHQHTPLSMSVDEPGSRLRVLAAGCLMEGDLGKLWPNGFQLVELDMVTLDGTVDFRKWSRRGKFWTVGSDIYASAPAGRLILRSSATPAQTVDNAAQGPARGEDMSPTADTNQSTLRFGFVADVQAKQVPLLVRSAPTQPLSDLFGRDPLSAGRAFDAIVAMNFRFDDVWDKFINIDQSFQARIRFQQLCSQCPAKMGPGLLSILEDSAHHGLWREQMFAASCLGAVGRSDAVDARLWDLLDVGMGRTHPEVMRKVMTAIGSRKMVTAGFRVSEVCRENSYSAEKLGPYAFDCLNQLASVNQALVEAFLRFAEWLQTTDRFVGRPDLVASLPAKDLDRIVARWISATHPHLRILALQAIGHHCTRRMVPSVAGMLRDPEGEVVIAALNSLSKIKTNASLDSIFRAFPRWDEMIREADISTETNGFDPTDVKALANALGEAIATHAHACLSKDEERLVRAIPFMPPSVLALCLASVSDDGARSVLRASAAHSAPLVRGVAAVRIARDSGGTLLAQNLADMEHDAVRGEERLLVLSALVLHGHADRALALAEEAMSIAFDWRDSFFASWVFDALAMNEATKPIGDALAQLKSPIPPPLGRWAD